MAFDISYLVGKTVLIGDLTAKVLSATDTEINLDPMTFSKYLNQWLIDGSETNQIQYLHTTTDPLSLILNVPIASIGSSYANIFININYESRAYRNTLPESKFIFVDSAERNSYFQTHKSELTTGLRIKTGSQFQLCIIPFWTQISAASVNPNHRFVDTAARDAYFTSNPTDLVNGLAIEIGGVWISAPSGTFTYAFTDATARDAYFALNPADLIDGIIVKLGPVKSGELEYPTVGDFPAVGDTTICYIAMNTGYCYEWTGSAYSQITYIYREYSCSYYEYTMESWTNTEPIFELLPVACTMAGTLTYGGGSVTSPISASSSSNTMSGTYDGICGNSNLAGTLGFRTTLTYGGENLKDNHFRIETDITISYKNSLGEALLDGSGCIPKSLTSSAIHVITS